MQTPKEKATSLVKAFYSITTTSTEAKQCAKVHITLILERHRTLKQSNNQTIEYYQEVLNEIEKL